MRRWQGYVHSVYGGRPLQAIRSVLGEQCPLPGLDHVVAALAVVVLRLEAQTLGHCDQGHVVEMAKLITRLLAHVADQRTRWHGGKESKRGGFIWPLEMDKFEFYFYFAIFMIVDIGIMEFLVLRKYNIISK